MECRAISSKGVLGNVELLCYHTKQAAHSPPHSNDVAAKRLVFACDDVTEPQGLSDPDGHHLTFLPNPSLPRTA